MQAVRLPVVSLALLIGALLVGTDQSAQALPPSGSDRLPVVVTVETISQLGEDTIVLTGWAQLDRAAPRMEGGVEVVDVEIVGLSLHGASQIGAISAVERPNDGADYVSAGEVRSLQAGNDFPASSFFDVFVDVTVPLAFPGGDRLVIHNETPFRLTPREAGVEVDLTAWPPLGVVYELEPIFGVDNDGDTLIDEDTADEDGDLLYDEDRPGADPDTPGAGVECGFDADCDGQEGEDPPLDYCVQNDPTLCDDDGDGLLDEDPSCIPLMNPGNVNNMKAGFCVRNLTMEFAPELPSYSVARGGPSDLHPADVFALVPGDVSEPPPPPPPVAVSGNDAFADGWIIPPPLPFVGEQSTVGSTEETGEPAPCGGIASTVWFSFTPDESETVIIDTVGSGFDTVLAVYTGSAVDALTPIACNDDFPGLFFQSRISFPVTAGTTYHVQAGGFNGQTGDLMLNVASEAASDGDIDMAPFVRIACADLGLTADGCDDGSDGDQDDLDALSYGADLPVDAQPMLNFSVGPGAQGVAGSAVEAQRNCPPVQPGLSPEPEPDEFGSVLDGTNELVLDGNGPVGACTPAFPLGFVEAATVRDDLDALYAQDPAAVDADNDGVPESPVYFSLDADSPSLATLGFSAADILTTVSGGSPTVFASEAELGLAPGDDVDALCLRESGDSIYAAGEDLLYFSLAPGSPTLSEMGAGPGDLLTPDGPSPIVAQGRAYLGLVAGDDVNAVTCQALSKDPRGDLDGDTIANHIDLDDDNDGCTDEQELGPDETLGGRRNPSYFWDFFDPNRDGAISLLDFLAVLRHFGTVGDPSTFDPDAPEPPIGEYWAAADRGGQDPDGDLWDELPANGSIGLGDILSLLRQFPHTCGG